MSKKFCTSFGIDFKAQALQIQL